MAILHPDGFDKSKSSLVHLSDLRPWLWAVIVIVDVGEQNTSNKSSCSFQSFRNIAMSVFRSLCHFSFSFASHLPLAGDSISVGSGAASPSSYCPLPVFQSKWHPWAAGTKPAAARHTQQHWSSATKTFSFFFFVFALVLLAMAVVVVVVMMTKTSYCDVHRLLA